MTPQFLSVSLVLAPSVKFKPTLAYFTDSIEPKDLPPKREGTHLSWRKGNITFLPYSCPFSRPFLSNLESPTSYSLTYLHTHTHTFILQHNLLNFLLTITLFCSHLYLPTWWCSHIVSTFSYISEFLWLCTSALHIQTTQANASSSCGVGKSFTFNLHLNLEPSFWAVDWVECKMPPPKLVRVRHHGQAHH